MNYIEDLSVNNDQTIEAMRAHSFIEASPQFQGGNYNIANIQTLPTDN